MQLISRWVLPIAMVAVGIAILSGFVIPNLPNGSGLRFMFGLVAIMLGVMRFISARSGRNSAEDRRRFGGGRKRPWENP